MISRPPSWADYATHDESLYPHLWEGCQVAACAALGASGSTSYDFSRNNLRFSVAGATTPADLWRPVNGIPAWRFFKADTGRLDGGLLNFDITRSGQSFSISAWVNYVSSSTGGSGPILTIGDVDYKAISFGILANKFCVINPRTTIWQFLPTDYTGYSAVNFGKTYHVVFIFYGTTLRCSMYVNGALLSNTSAIQPTAIADSTIIRIGSHYSVKSTHMADSYIDDVRVYDRALEPDEVILLSKGRGISYTSRRKVNRFYSFPFNPAWARHSNVILPGVSQC